MRLLSYNIHKGVGGRDRRYRLDRVIEVVEQENPDLICLQEVDRNVKRTRHDDQAHLFVTAFRPIAHLYQLNVRLKEGGYGNLVLSRWPLQSHHQISLRMERRKPRGAQICVVETPEGPLHLIHWHLGLAEKERHWQADHLMRHALFRESCHLPTLIVGDYNDWRNTLGVKGALGREGFHQVTAPRSRFRSFPAYLPMTALDKAYTRGAVTIRHARIARSKLARDASDHLPLVIDFHLRPQPTPG
ncbi:endonuclease/exonuclease/phosphatase family protein [Paludisphaera rhizosphaerae]|uniref:endonuclease/exonuclease/phosphatase family protein n=1 Tax=Paludisphaera rhizosphaerae TaxID=2711216 RepID=UPI0013ECFD61|nr:endonuclease/exonuclease/phosphatase family protein [Paludisphaera rhizosphaerae]